MTRKHRTLENTEPRSRDMMQTRVHPLLASHNPWTWKFFPGVVLGFLAHWWLSKNKDQQVQVRVPPAGHVCWLVN